MRLNNFSLLLMSTINWLIDQALGPLVPLGRRVAFWPMFEQFFRLVMAALAQLAALYESLFDLECNTPNFTIVK
jgi:hypothetical protein